MENIFDLFYCEFFHCSKYVLKSGFIKTKVVIGSLFPFIMYMRMGRHGHATGCVEIKEQIDRKSVPSLHHVGHQDWWQAPLRKELPCRPEVTHSKG